MANEVSGSDGGCTVGGVTIPITGWNYSGKINLIECTNSEDAGEERDLKNTKRRTGSIKGFYSTTTPPYGSAPLIPAGTDLTLKLIIGKTGNKFFTGPAIAEENALTLEVKGGVQYSINFKSQGAWTDQDGNPC